MRDQYSEIKRCRICGNADLIPILDLGIQALTGVFPKDTRESITSGPLQLVKCHENHQGETCGLVQLRHSYNLNEMYGMNYGYRSGLNRSMIEHLNSLVAHALSIVQVSEADLILDIGSNDGTLLNCYPQSGALMVGMDPTAKKFRKYYPDHVCVIDDFFSSASFLNEFGSRKAKIVTSIAMFYDLESPSQFVAEICDILADDGIWIFEQSYMPAILLMNAYDTVCHEHLEYYGIRQIRWLMDRVKLKIVDAALNDANGGSFCVTVAKESAPYRECLDTVKDLMNEELNRGLNTLKPYEEFRERVLRHRDLLNEFVNKCQLDGKRLIGYGASTKGNVILQFCGLGPADISCIAEVNEDKFGRFTPGSLIPIVSEKEAKEMSPEYFLVLPWHFKNNIVDREREFLEAGGHLVFPLPTIHVV